MRKLLFFVFVLPLLALTACSSDSSGRYELHHNPETGAGDFLVFDTETSDIFFIILRNGDKLGPAAEWNMIPGPANPNSEINPLYKESTRSPHLTGQK